LASFDARIARTPVQENAFCQLVKGRRFQIFEFFANFRKSVPRAKVVAQENFAHEIGSIFDGQEESVAKNCLFYSATSKTQPQNFEVAFLRL
jgi:hypothetical protein